MGLIKNQGEIAGIRAACRIAATVLEEIGAQVRPGITTAELDVYAADRIKARGARSAFLGYRGFPKHTCLSVNEEVVHGLAGARRLQFGDIISVDVGVLFRGFVGDTASTFAVGGCEPAVQRLMDVTLESLGRGIAQARGGSRIVEISRAVQEAVEIAGFSVVREFVGHGVGLAVHEEPQVPNFVESGGRSPRLKPGMTIAIEPMVNAGRRDVRVLNDGWTVVTADGKLSAHFEHTVLVTDGGPEILTCREKTP
ncbi:MAG: type I methionyl aminopeptidase [Candidatus Woesebacteria bacterium]|nr:type I methionyl aminopeptidase [Candidatus Woesebacteria bacterium]